MPSRWGKRRRRDDEDDTVDLSSPEHAWWAAPDEPEPTEPVALDPYDVLGIDQSASWDDITAARRRLVKALHPDTIAGASNDERARHENAIRDINAAYSELKTRKGM